LRAEEDQQQRELHGDRSRAIDSRSEPPWTRDIMEKEVYGAIDAVDFESFSKMDNE
jgi:hypothetical protein